MSFGCLLVGLARLGQGEHHVDDGPELPRVNQRANFDQFVMVGFDDKIGIAYVLFLFYSSGRLRTDDGNKRSSRFDHLPGTLQGVSANGIEDQIDSVNHFLEARGSVVDDLVGPQFTQEVAITGRSGRDDLRSYLESKGVDPVNLDKFRILPSSKATGAQDIGRLTNLMV